MCNARESDPGPRIRRATAIPTCRDMSELVTAYLDGALPLATRVKARLHLVLCHACRRYFDQMRQTARFLSRAPRSAPAPEIEQRLLDAIAAEARHGHGHGNSS